MFLNFNYYYFKKVLKKVNKEVLVLVFLNFNYYYKYGLLSKVVCF